jgi:hypothetical protein
MDAFNSGTLAGAGSFRCETCGFALALQELDALPPCPECGGLRFRRSLLFESGRPHLRHEVAGPPGWLEDARESLEEDGDYLAFAGGEGTEVVPLRLGWNRIGRSLAADVRFDDPTVSRRHALVYCDEGGEARILDDRSLNGVFRNGDRVELAELHDGDEIAIGRFTLFFLRPGERAGGRHARAAIAR